jgi:DNA-binding winged helix-turn-helix (wHTH) protein
MIKREVTIKGITYTVRSTTEHGVEQGIKMLRKALRTKKEKPENGI